MERAAPPKLIFDTKTGNASLWKLIFFIGVSILGHVAMFYLFKVVTPSTTRRLPPEESVLVLRSGDPLTSSILSSLEDRSPASLLVRNGSVPEILREGPTLPAYRPSFYNYQPRIEFDWAPPAAPLPLLADSNRPQLPKLGKNPPTPRPEPDPIAKGATPKLLLSGNLETRGLVTRARWALELSPPEEEVEPHLFHVAINASGAVTYCLSDGLTPPPSILQTVQNLKFTRRAGAGLEWGTIEVHW
jgi:hypothetical protein